MLGGERIIFIRYQAIEKSEEIKVPNETTINELIDLFITKNHLDGSNDNYTILYKSMFLDSTKRDMTLLDLDIQNYDTLILKNKVLITSNPNHNPHIINYLMSKLRHEFKHGQQIIISMMSANLKTHSGTEVEISQQIKFDRINPDSTEIIIILYDQIFFDPRADLYQLYNLVNLTHEPLPDLPNDSDNFFIRKYVKPADSLFVLNDTNSELEKYREYFNAYNSDKTRINKKITWYILKYYDPGKGEISDFKRFAIKYNMVDQIQILGYSQ
jgi:hypothetical protein